MKRRKIFGTWVKTAHDANDYVTINGAVWYPCWMLPGPRYTDTRPRVCYRCLRQFIRGSGNKGYRPMTEERNPVATDKMLLCDRCVGELPFARPCDEHEWRYLSAHSHFVWRRQCQKCFAFERKFKEVRLAFFQGLPEGTRNRRALAWNRPLGEHGREWDRLNPDPTSRERVPHEIKTRYPGGVLSGLWRARRRAEVR